MSIHANVRAALHRRRAEMRPPWSMTDIARVLRVPRSTLVSALRRGLGEPGGVQVDAAPVVVRGHETARPAVTMGDLAGALEVDEGELTEGGEG